MGWCGLGIAKKGNGGGRGPNLSAPDNCHALGMHSCDWEWPTLSRYSLGVGDCRNRVRKRVFGRGGVVGAGRVKGLDSSRLCRPARLVSLLISLLTPVLQGALRNSSSRLDVNQPLKGKSQARFLAAPNPYRGF